MLVRRASPLPQDGDRRLVLRPLPAFTDVPDDREESAHAVEAAAGLVRRVELASSKVEVGTAVLQM